MSPSHPGPTWEECAVIVSSFIVDGVTHHVRAVDHYTTPLATLAPLESVKPAAVRPAAVRPAAVPMNRLEYLSRFISDPVGCDDMHPLGDWLLLHAYTCYREELARLAHLRSVVAYWSYLSRCA